MGVLADVGDRLVRIRTLAGLDPQTAAVQARIDAERLESAEAGETALTEDEIARLAAAYGVDTSEIFGGRVTPVRDIASG